MRRSAATSTERSCRFDEDVIVKILGENFLRALGMLRG
jgi:hypothetical protein